MRVKICGITNGEDARIAAEAGTDALGFNLWTGSKRSLISSESDFRVPQWLLSLDAPHVLRVAVVVNPSPEFLQRITQTGAFDAIQFHGDETPEQCARCPLPWWKAFPAGKNSGRDFQGGEFSGASAWVLDAPAPPGTYGGTGTTGDWSAAADIVRSNPERLIYLAGGLRPDNVAEAIRCVKPGGVDVAGGVECSDPRRKDPAKVREFIRLAKASG